jgi:hypothetical protein
MPRILIRRGDFRCGTSGGSRRHSTVLLALVAGVLTIAASGGCSGKDAGGKATAGKAAGGQRASLPGIKEFGLTEEQFAGQVEKTQSLIAACMAEAGFEYVPVDVKTVELAQKYVRSDPAVSRRDYHAKWGYAVTTRFDDPSRAVGLGEQNMKIMKGLPESDQEAYDRTLFGENHNADFAFTLDEEDFSSTGGCTRKAVAAVFTPTQVDGTFTNPKDVLIDGDKRIVAARAEWSKCMRGHGYNYKEDQDEIIDEYGERLDKLVGDDDPETLTGERAAALRTLQAEEVAASMADLDCEIKHTDAVYRAVEIEVYGQPVSG